jgi:hypothetical protein
MAPKQFFILQDFWPLLKFCQIMGIFPCKRITDENGCANLKPMKTWMLVLLWLTWSFILPAPYIGIMIYLESDSELITATMASSQDSQTRNGVTGFLLLMTSILQFVLVLSNIKSLKVLCCMQDEFVIMFGSSRLKNSSIKKAYLLSVIFFVFILIQVITSVLGTVLPMQDLIGDDQNGVRTLVIVLIFVLVLSMLGSFSGIFQGLALHLQLCCNVKMIIKSFDFNEMTCSRIVLQNTVKILKTVRMSSNVLSSQSLILVLNMLIMLICQSYLCMDYALSTAYQNTAFQCAQNIFGALSAALALWILNAQSEEIKQSLSTLKDTLRGLEVSNGIIEIDGRVHSEAYARGVLINKLAEFQGFNAYGYATLGKPLLTSVFANFITYLIILIQFKISID